MNILAVVGSSRSGNTNTMVQAAVSALNGSVNIDILKLGDLAYEFCDGCLQCDETGECHFNDDMKTAIETVKSADGLIIGTPARWGLLSGELKSFFDRLNPLAGPELLSGKKAIIFAVGQSDEDSEDAESIRLACASLETFCENADIEVVAKVCAFGCLNSQDAKDNSAALEDCREAARKLMREI